VFTFVLSFVQFFYLMCSYSLLPKTFQIEEGHTVLLYEKYACLIDQRDHQTKILPREGVNENDPIDVAAYRVTKKLRDWKEDLRKQCRRSLPRPAPRPTAQTDDVAVTLSIEEVQDSAVSYDRVLSI